MRQTLSLPRTDRCAGGDGKDMRERMSCRPGRAPSLTSRAPRWRSRHGVEVRERAGETAETSLLRVTNSGRADATVRRRSGPKTWIAASGAIRRDSSGRRATFMRRLHPSRVGTTRIQGDGEVLLGAREFAVPCAGWGKGLPLETPGKRTCLLPPTAIRGPARGSVFLRNPSDDATETLPRLSRRETRGTRSS